MTDEFILSLTVGDNLKALSTSISISCDFFSQFRSRFFFRFEKLKSNEPFRVTGIFFTFRMCLIMRQTIGIYIVFDISIYFRICESTAGKHGYTRSTSNDLFGIQDEQRIEILIKFIARPSIFHIMSIDHHCHRQSMDEIQNYDDTMSTTIEIRFQWNETAKNLNSVKFCVRSWVKSMSFEYEWWAEGILMNFHLKTSINRMVKKFNLNINGWHRVRIGSECSAETRNCKSD